MKKLTLLVAIVVLAGFCSNAYADEKVIGFVPSPEGDYQNLKTENLAVSGGSPQPGEVLTAIDSQGSARWIQPSSSLTAGNTGTVDWDYGIKVGGGNPDYWGECSMGCVSTTGAGRCTPHSRKGVLINCDDGRPMLTLLRNTTGSGEWMTWHYRSYCVTE